MSYRVGFFVALVAFSLALAIPQTALSYEYSYARVVRLSLVEGDVQVARPDQQGWETAIVNLPIQQGYTLATGNGRAEVEFESGATARLAENSVLQFTELALESGSRITKLTLTQGTATFYANLSRDDSFVVLTPQLQVNLPENARFRLDVYDQGTTVSVLKGEVAVDSAAGSHRLTKGHTLAYRSDQPDQVQLERSPKPDEWDRWVANRDDGISTARNASLRYVSAPYSYGLADLGNYGNWLYVPSYGYAWQPWGVSSGWLPYWNGRWAFFHGLGWTWLSYEPWGWMPYHFGRWLYSPGFGWVWVPGYFNQWCPATVYWVQAGNRIGWAPLGPRDPPGQVPKNPNGGVVVTNTPTGLMGGAPHQRLNLDADEKPRFLLEPPIPVDDSVGISRAVPGQFRGVTATRGGSGTSSASPTKPATPDDGTNLRTPARPGPRGARPDIVFDPEERKFVNNPAAPVRLDATGGVAPTQATPAPAPRSSPRTATVTPPVPARPPVPRGADRDVLDLPRPPMIRERDSVPVPRPNVASPPRGEIHRPAPPPARLERPPARIESPRSAPAPPPRMQPPAPRPSSPPPAPRGESRPSPRPHGSGE